MKKTYEPVNLKRRVPSSRLLMYSMTISGHRLILNCFGRIRWAISTSALTMCKVASAIPVAAWLIVEKSYLINSYGNWQLISWRKSVIPLIPPKQRYWSAEKLNGGSILIWSSCRLIKTDSSAFLQGRNNNKTNYSIGSCGIDIIHVFCTVFARRIWVHADRMG